MNFREITAGGESDNIAPDPRDPESSTAGAVDKLDPATMQTQSVDPTLADPGKYRRTWTLPLVFSPRDPRRPLLRATRGSSAPRTAASTGA